MDRASAQRGHTGDAAGGEVRARGEGGVCDEEAEDSGFRPCTSHSSPARMIRANGCQDSTLIVPASGKKHGDSATDWKWWHSSVSTRLKALYNEEG